MYLLLKIRAAWRSVCDTWATNHGCRLLQTDDRHRCDIRQDDRQVQSGDRLIWDTSAANRRADNPTIDRDRARSVHRHKISQGSIKLLRGHRMHAIKVARKFIEQQPDSDSARTLSRLVLALESEADFPISDIYKLDFESFQLALKILDEWRLDRYASGKVRLFDLSLQMAKLHPRP
jgi:hypothetical protein